MRPHEHGGSDWVEQTTMCCWCRVGVDHLLERLCSLEQVAFGERAVQLQDLRALEVGGRVVASKMNLPRIRQLVDDLWRAPMLVEPKKQSETLTDTHRCMCVGGHILFPRRGHRCDLRLRTEP